MPCKTPKVFPSIYNDYFIIFQKELHKHLDVIAVDLSCTNLASITQCLEAVILTLNYENLSTNNKTDSTIKANIP